MPAPKTTNSRSREHLQEAYENYCRYKNSLDQHEYLNWAIVFLFYEAPDSPSANAGKKTNV